MNFTFVSELNFYVYFLFFSILFQDHPPGLVCGKTNSSVLQILSMLLQHCQCFWDDASWCKIKREVKILSSLCVFNNSKTDGFIIHCSKSLSLIKLFSSKHVQMILLKNPSSAGNVFLMYLF